MGFFLLVDIECSIAGGPLVVRCKQSVRVSAKLSFLWLRVVTELLAVLRQVDGDGVLHDVDHLSVGHLAVNLHHGDGVALVVSGGVGGDDSREEEGHEGPVGLGVVGGRDQEVVATEGDHVESVVTSVNGLEEGGEGVPGDVAEHTQGVG